MKLAQEQSAKQVLSVSMQQSLQILQMPLSQLQSYLTEQLLGNPLAEMEIQDPDAVSVEEMMEIRDQFDFLDDFDSFDTSGVSISDIPFPTRRGETLSEHLLAQLNEDIHLPREYLPWCSFLVKNLDRRGYLDESMDLLGCNPGYSSFRCHAGSLCRAEPFSYRRRCQESAGMFVAAIGGNTGF